MVKKISVERQEILKAVEKLLNITFKDKELLDKALTHKSYTHESGHEKRPHNERLEFFGDAVLKLVISEYLLLKYPEHTEGQLTKVRASAVSDNHLYKLSRDLELGKFLRMSINEKRTGGEKRKSNLANLLEALFGAAYLDTGIAGSTKLILSVMKKSIDLIILEDKEKDFKSSLQEFVQRAGWQLPDYKVIKETGPDHHKLFTISVRVGKGLKRAKSDGVGRTKKDAEQEAAKNLIDEIQKKYPSLVKAKLNKGKKVLTARKKIK